MTAMRSLFLYFFLCKASFAHFRDEIPPVTIAYEMAKYSEMIYHVESINSTEILDGLTPHFFENTQYSNQMMVLTNDSLGIIVLVFKGSLEPIDWLNVVDVRPSPFGPDDATLYDGGFVHAGINRVTFCDDAYTNTESALLELLDAYPDYSVYLTGHSLGGAIAMSFGAYLTHSRQSQTSFHKNITVVTFGATSVGGPKFEFLVNQGENLAVWRFVRDQDPGSRFFEPIYKHVGHMIWLKDDGAKLYYDDIRKDSQHASLPVSYLVALNFNQHRMHIGYLPYIEELSIVNPGTFYVTKFETEEQSPYWLSDVFHFPQKLFSWLMVILGIK